MQYNVMELVPCRPCFPSKPSFLRHHLIKAKPRLAHSNNGLHDAVSYAQIDEKSAVIVWKTFCIIFCVCICREGYRSISL